MRARVLCLIADRPSLSALGAGGVDEQPRSGVASRHGIAAFDHIAAALAAARGRALLIDRGHAPGRIRLADLERLRALTREHDALLMVSGRVDLALASGADGVHLPERGLPAAAVRAAWPGLLIGRSCHDRAGLVAAAEDGADYALLAPVADPLSKPASAPTLGVPGFAAAVAGLALPVFALGGVVPDLAGPLRQAGAAGLASLGGVLLRTDPGAAARLLLAAWDASAS